MNKTTKEDFRVFILGSIMINAFWLGMRWSWFELLPVNAILLIGLVYGVLDLGIIRIRRMEE